MDNGISHWHEGSVSKTRHFVNWNSIMDTASHSPVGQMGDKIVTLDSADAHYEKMTLLPAYVHFIADN